MASLTSTGSDGLKSWKWSSSGLLLALVLVELVGVACWNGLNQVTEVPVLERGSSSFLLAFLLIILVRIAGWYRFHLSQFKVIIVKAMSSRFDSASLLFLVIRITGWD